MKVIFVSNYINHHQIPLANVMYEKFGDGYKFIQTEPMEEERVKMGWGSALGSIPYLLKFYECEEECRKLIDESDVVIFGGTEREELIEDRLEKGLPVIRYCERLYKEGQWKCISPRGLKKKYHDHTRHSDKPVYLLCAGGYVQDDFNIIRAYKNKRFKWGYFPEFITYSDDERKARRDERRTHEKLEILWAGRLIELKHPESTLILGEYLKKKGIPFHITVIGDGEMRQRLEEMRDRKALSEDVTFLGAKLPGEVPEYMNSADVFLFTSNFIEGWGAVINESMNASCAIVTSHAPGSVPTLIKHRQNGLIYPFNDMKIMCSLVEELSANQKWRLSLGENAYDTLANEWNYRVAGERLARLCEQIADGKPTFYESGPLSEAKVIHQRNMYKYLVGER